MSPSIKLMLVEDHQIVLAGLRMLLQSQPDIEIVAEAHTGPDAVSLSQKHLPDVVLMDIGLPEMNGIEATRQLKQAQPQVAVLALTIHEEEAYLFQMLKAGASGYIPKRAASEDLLNAIHAVYQGETYLHTSIAGALVQEYVQQNQPDTINLKIPSLTIREEEVLTLIAQGLTNKQIGEQLDISPKTVARHRDNISQKLKLSTRSDLTRYAIQQGLVSL